MSAPFNPLTVAETVIQQTELSNPDAIAQEVFNRTPKESMADAYRLTLRDVARRAIRYMNATTLEAPAPKEGEPVAQSPRTKPNKSSKVAAIRERHLAYYDQRVTARGVWKKLGDCDYEDLLDLAQFRRNQADKNLAKAVEYERLAERMKESGAKVARDLGAKAVAA